MKELNFSLANICVGGVQESTFYKLQKIGGQCSPSIKEGWCQAR